MEELEPCKECQHFLHNIDKTRLAKAIGGIVKNTSDIHGPISPHAIATIQSNTLGAIWNFLFRVSQHDFPNEPKPKKRKACPTPEKVARPTLEAMEEKRLSLPSADDLLSYSCRCGRYHMRSKSKTVILAENDKFKLVSPRPGIFLWYTNFRGREKTIKMDLDNAREFAFFILDSVSDEENRDDEEE